MSAMSDDQTIQSDEPCYYCIGSSDFFCDVGRCSGCPKCQVGRGGLTVFSWSIRQTTPQDGIVNFITGDNQTTGNRMILGWRESDILYLRLAHPQEAAIGDLFTIYKRVHKVFHPRTKEYMGYLVIMTGVVRVIENDSPLTMVQIVRAYSPVSPGDPVMRFVPPPLEESASEVGVPTDTEGLIVDLQSDKTMSLVGQGNVVYLDRGRADGIHAGDRLEVFRIGGPLPRRKVGEAQSHLMRRSNSHSGHRAHDVQGICRG